jgi:hypothetical protein
MKSARARIATGFDLISDTLRRSVGCGTTGRVQHSTHRAMDMHFSKVRIQPHRGEMLVQPPANRDLDKSC